MCVWTHFSCMYTPQTMQMSPGSTNHKIVHLFYPPRRQTKENHEKSTRNHYSVELQTACERNDSGWAINKSCCQLNVDAWIGGGWMYYTYTIEVGWSGMLPVVTSDILRIACNCFGHTKARRGSWRHILLRKIEGRQTIPWRMSMFGVHHKKCALENIVRMGLMNACVCNVALKRQLKIAIN